MVIDEALEVLAPYGVGPPDGESLQRRERQGWVSLVSMAMTSGRQDGVPVIPLVPGRPCR